MTASVPLPACTMITMRRGRSSDFTKSAMSSLGMKAPSVPWAAIMSCVLAKVRLWMATV